MSAAKIRKSAAYRYICGNRSAKNTIFLRNLFFLYIEAGEMFTGLIEEIGVVASVERRGTSKRLTVKANIVMSDMKTDDSIAVNGTCQTVVSCDANIFSVDSIDETLRKTTLGTLSVGSRVNLERAIRAGGRFGGHIVQGHVDCVGIIRTINDIQGSRQMWIEFPREFSRYVVPVGSVCLDGISLTVARVESARIMVALIPHTLSVTALGERKVGDNLNIEFDIIGKYVENMTAGYRTDTPSVFESMKIQPEL